MSLLQKASIITTPTAYAEDYLYSIKPAFKLGDNLNTDFSYTGFAPNSGVKTVSNGVVNLSSTGANTYAILAYQNQGLIAKGYQQRFQISGFYRNISATNVYVAFFNGSSQSTIVPNYSGTTFKYFNVTITTGASNTQELKFNSGVTGANQEVEFKDITIQHLEDADFDFDRNSTGTRVNEDYLIEDVPYNLLTYSEEITSGNGWIIQSGVTVTNNDVLAPNGTLTADKLVGNGTVGVYKQVAVTGVVTRSVYLKSVTGNVNVVIKDPMLTVTTKTLSVTQEWQRFQLSESNGHASFSGIWIDDIPASGIYMWGAQLVKGDQPKDYLKTTDRLDIPRIDYTNGEPSILLEPSRTNDILNNTNLSQWLIGAGITVTSNAVNSPEGIQNADKIEKTSQSFTYVRQSLGTGYVSVFSIFVKQGNYRYIGIRNNDSGHSVFDFETKSFVTSLSDHNLSVQQFPNGWFRLIDERTISTNTNGLRGIALTLANGAEFDAGIPLNAFAYAWGGQLENNQTYETSLIHTSGSAVTRSADAANNAGNSDLINSTEGVLYLEIAALAVESSVRQLAISDGTANEAVKILYLNSTQIRIELKTASGTDFVKDVTVTTNEFQKIALQYKASNYKVFLNGVAQSVTQTSAVASGLDRFNFDRGDGADDWYGKVKSLMIFKEALTDLKLAKLTGYNNHELYMNYYNRLSYLGLVEEYNVESDINNYIL